MATQKPLLDDSYGWARGSENEIDLIIPYEKIDSGWKFGDKPPYQYVNWFWNSVSKFLINWNQNGIPEWDSETEYKSSGYVKYEDNMYQSFSNNKNDQPSLTSRTWKREETLIGLKDVYTDLLQDRDLLVLTDEVWGNYVVKNVIDIELDDLINVDASGGYDTVLSYDSVTDPSNPVWVQKTIKDAYSEKIYLNDIFDVKIENLTEGQILVFDETEYYDEDLDETGTTAMWINEDPNPMYLWDNIVDAPYEFSNIKPASQEYVGGAKMWIAECQSDSSKHNLYIQTY